jgi:hypothetical protein
MEEDWKDKWARYLLESVLILVLTASFYIFVYLYYIGYVWKYPILTEGISFFTFLTIGNVLFTKFVEIGLCAIVIILLYKYKQYLMKKFGATKFWKPINTLAYHYVFVINLFFLVALLYIARESLSPSQSIGYKILLILTISVVIVIWSDKYNSISSKIKDSSLCISVAVLFICIVMPCVIYFGIIVLPNIWGQNAADFQQNKEDYTQITFDLYDYNPMFSGKNFSFIATQNGRYYIKDVNDSTEYIIQDSYVKTATIKQAKKLSNTSNQNPSNTSSQKCIIQYLDDTIRGYLLYSPNKPIRSAYIGS